jgi:putative SOS response-associated peptidase YedK
MSQFTLDLEIYPIDEVGRVPNTHSFPMSITGDVLACLMRWSLVPYWAKDIKIGFANINAKTEGIEKTACSCRQFL